MYRLILFLLTFVSAVAEMSWFWNAFQSNGKRNNTRKESAPPLLTRQTSVRIRQFENKTRRTGSLILNKEDLQVIKLQNKIDNTRRKLNHQRLDHEDEIQVMRNLKENLRVQFTEKLDKLLEDEVYDRVIIASFKEAGLTLAHPGNGRREGQVLKAIQRSEIQEKSRALFQQQASAELMETYKTGPAMKERMSELEAKLLSAVCQIDSLNTQRKELLESYVKTQQSMIEMLEKAHQEQLQKHFEALRNGTLEEVEDGDLVARKERRAIAETRSAIASTSAVVEERTDTMGMTDVMLEDEDPQRVGEVKSSRREQSQTTKTSTADDDNNTSSFPESPTRRSSSGYRPALRGSLATRGSTSRPSGTVRGSTRTGTERSPKGLASRQRLGAGSSRPGLSSTDGEGQSPNSSGADGDTVSSSRRPRPAGRSPMRRPTSNLNE